MTYVCKEYSSFHDSKPIFIISDFKISPKIRPDQVPRWPSNFAPGIKARFNAFSGEMAYGLIPKFDGTLNSVVEREYF